MKSCRSSVASFHHFPAPAGARRGVLAVAVMLLCVPAAHAFDSGSTGADGGLNPAVSTQIELPPSGILNYSSVNIPTGVTVTFKKNALNTPVQVLSSGDITIAGSIDIRGGSAAATGTAGDGNQGDDGLPGLGGPGGFDGGRGGKDDLQNRVDVNLGGSGLGPGGGRGGYTRADGCFSGTYYHYVGQSAGYATGGIGYYASCPEVAGDSERGQPYGTPELLPLIGGSGGGGGRGGANYPGAGGGGGGGAILLASSGTLTVTGSINATGGDAGDIAGTGAGQIGGGGSGGAIKLMASSIKGNGGLTAVGGCRVVNGTARQYCGNNTSGYTQGSDGRIRIEGESITFSGTSQPTYTTSTPQPIATTNLPSIRIASVAGTSVPANPTGNADVSLPATTTDPVVVMFATTNVPTGNAIKLRVVPAYGAPIEVLSPAISGTAANGSASVSVTLPQGPSVLQAITSYTVTVAQAESLSRFANNERVERVELVASLGQESIVELTTASGKRYSAPAAVLKIAGLAG
ncbi:MAG: hypothetical protein FWD62_08090 [Betaproteobacteria bacterium]|nr:hypothetical protein [Betaproteobacteria bacterium]